MKRVLIIGNSGSGKSWLSSRLSSLLQVKEVNLDSVVWEPGGYNQKRSQASIDLELDKISAQSSWVVEGVFGALAEQLVPVADTLIFLDIEWSVCKQSLLLRGSESSKQLDNELAEKNFQELLKWASEYGLRTSKSSHQYHSQLFAGFTGNKIYFSTRDEVNDFVCSLKKNVECLEKSPH
ncbi:AAA family ATPase [Photobacterium alginatilyticum]|uniref:AAA family ATPase n=1 Tax=Photobacterium alginatilyticum TaxID=1775171 RepID=UPI004067FEE7